MRPGKERRSNCQAIVVKREFVGHQRSQAADFPLVIPQAMVPIGLSIMAFLVAVRLLVPQWRRKSQISGH